MTISAHTTIEADAPRVWALLCDVRHWPQLLPDTVTRVTPEQPDRPDEVGARYTMEQPRLPRAVWEITEWAPPQRFTWHSRSLGVTTTGTHVVTPLGDDRAEASLAIDWSGPLAGLVRLLYGRLTQGYVDIEAQRLKARAEAA